MNLTCLIPGPDRLMFSRPAGDRWCFGCRARLPLVDEVWCDSRPSYYDPILVRKCSRCQRDRTAFPGSIG